MVETILKQQDSLTINSSISKLTFEEYLKYEDNTDHKYELHEGILIAMATPTGLHADICKYLLYQFQTYFANLELNLIAVNEIGIRIAIDSVRIPDLIISSLENWQKVRTRKGAGVFDLGETPQLVIEVSSENWRDDYILKRAQYALIEIPEYWIVNPNKKIVRILNNPEQEDGYKHCDFVSGENIKSLEFPDLILSVDEIVSPPIVEALVKAEKNEKKQLQLELESEKNDKKQLQLELENERQRAENERLRAENEHLRAEKLETILRENGINFN
jgi:Uma2 family endonuclease